MEKIRFVEYYKELKAKKCFLSSEVCSIMFRDGVITFTLPDINTISKHEYNKIIGSMESVIGGLLYTASPPKECVKKAHDTIVEAFESGKRFLIFKKIELPDKKYRFEGIDCSSSNTLNEDMGVLLPIRRVIEDYILTKGLFFSMNHDFISMENLKDGDVISMDFSDSVSQIKRAFYSIVKCEKYDKEYIDYLLDNGNTINLEIKKDKLCGGFMLCPTKKPLTYKRKFFSIDMLDVYKPPITKDMSQLTSKRIKRNWRDYIGILSENYDSEKIEIKIKLIIKDPIISRDNIFKFLKIIDPTSNILYNYINDGSIHIDKHGKILTHDETIEFVSDLTIDFNEFACMQLFL
ncbi:MAG: hypothetical protein ACRCX2_11275 [Paraclostridium sp.]